MKTLQLHDPDRFDARPLPEFTNDDKFVFYSPTAHYDSDGSPLPAPRRGNVVQVTNEQYEQLMSNPWGARFVEVETPAGKAPKAARGEGGS